MFFFTSEDETKQDAKEIYEYIKERVKENVELKTSSQAAPRQDEAALARCEGAAYSAADEILKFKQLLDMGAITQEEYDAKKKQLLDL